GIIHWQSGDFDRTVTEMNAAVAASPDYAQAWYMLGTALKQKGDVDAASQALRKAISLEDSDPGPHNTLALMLRQRGDAEGAKAEFARAAELKAAAEKRQAEMLRRGPSHGLP
ncbi:MAG: protein O-GlcNAc transferase, partial [Bryobacterales bacterium]|nr:protein O-GlcNAc transferase [Bryobacterales bacterium]